MAEPEIERLRGDEIHFWQKQLDAPVGIGSHPYLHPEERLHASRFKFARDGLRYAEGRVFMRDVLSRYLDERPESIRIGYGADGKPFVGSVEFNISHAADVCVVAVGRAPLGVDVERVVEERFGSLLATRIMTETELTAWLHLPLGMRPQTLCRLWTRKEAYAKAIGTGLTTDVERLAFGLDPSPRCILSLPSAAGPEEWRFEELESKPGFITTVACRGRDWTVVQKCRSLALS